MGPNLGPSTWAPIGSQNRPNWAGEVEDGSPFLGFDVGRPWKTDLGAIWDPSWDPSWASMGPTWGHIGPSWGSLGAILGPCRGQLGSFRAFVDLLGGASLGHLWSSGTYCLLCRILGAMVMTMVVICMVSMMVMAVTIIKAVMIGVIIMFMTSGQ